MSILAGALLATSACSGTSAATTEPAKTEQSRSAEPRPATQPQAPVASAALKAMLLKPVDLGAGYSEDPSDAADKDNYGIAGCPALEKLSTGNSTGELKSAVQVKTGFAYGTESGMSEELDSDSPANLSAQLRTVYDAYAACPSFTITSGMSPIDATAAKAVVPDLGDERHGVIITMRGPGGTMIVKQIAIRKGNVAVLLMGSPGLVDKHIDKALSKVTPG
ncbi:hypothetical protein EDD96_6769 [Streptomyces sp. Ag109_G2-6]|uniref:hypothetical protein n=1 Tax=Streptomyces TaxID=1883 RepID=UPI000CC3F6F7|nr:MULTISPECIES: hypothetical protein [Streptomyces]RPF30180.1 hypothetical protein EDD96_6769 [Streptomyces sp. Ag109_G2-6]